MADAPNPSNRSIPSSASNSSLSDQPPTKNKPTTTTIREYEFFVTTEKPHLPHGAERGMIRRLVMRNFFDTKATAPLVDKSEHSSAATVMTRQQLSSRFRLNKSATEKDNKGAKSTLKRGKGKNRAERHYPTKATMEASLTDEPIRKRCNLPGERRDKSQEEGTESALKTPRLRIDPSSHRIDPFDILPVPGTPQFDLLFQLCTYDSSAGRCGEWMYILVNLPC